MNSIFQFQVQFTSNSCKHRFNFLKECGEKFYKMTSDTEDETAVIVNAAASTIVFDEQFKTQKRQKRKIWVTPWLLERNKSLFRNISLSARRY